MILREELKGDICVSDLIIYMEKMQSALRKLKHWSCRRKKQEEARSLNRQFKQDPGRIFVQLNAILESDKESERPVYKAESNRNNRDTSMNFENIGEASDFWKDLWQTESTGDKDAGWLQEVKVPIWRQVAPPEEEDWVLPDLESGGSN